MWSKTLACVVRTEIKKPGRPGFRLCVVMALYPISGLLLSFDPLLGLIPGGVGEKVRLVIDSIHGMIYALMESEPQTFADIDIDSEEARVRVNTSTFGFHGEEN